MKRLLAILPCLLLTVAGCSSDEEPGGSSSADTDRCTGSRCGGGSDSGADNDGGGGPGAGILSCDENSDCPTGVCNINTGVCAVACLQEADCGPLGECVSGICQPRPSCGASADCSGPAGVCDTCLGVCVDSSSGTACTGDQNCGFDEFCDPCVNLCRPRLELCDACSADSQCGESADACVAYANGVSYCGQACGNCPIGYECGPDGQCLAISGDCQAVRQCTTPEECPRGQTCSATFQCVDGCDSDEACPGDTVCAAGACIPPCASSADCPAGAECTNQRCMIPGGCLTSRDCLEPQTYCDTGTNRCVAGCQTDVDCGVASLACEAGSCVPRGCGGNFSCAFNQVCNLGTGECEDAVGPFCDDCNGDDVNSCGNANACLNLQDADGNDQGSFCFVGCEPGETNRCPQGYGCQEVDLGDEGVRELCIRNCAED